MLRQGVNSDGQVLRDAYVEHDPVDVDFSGEVSLTRQEFAQECDINYLMRTYEKTGLPFNDKPLEYFDVTDIPDLQTAMSLMMKAETAFMSLHANVRKEFDNDPLKFVAFAEDPANIDRMREWGLAPPVKAPEKPVEVRVVPEPQSPPAKPEGSKTPA